jgi:hypothetical protein
MKELTNDEIRNHFRMLYGNLKTLHETINLVALRAIELAELVDTSSAKYPAGFRDRLDELMFDQSLTGEKDAKGFPIVKNPPNSASDPFAAYGGHEVKPAPSYLPPCGK